MDTRSWGSESDNATWRLSAWQARLLLRAFREAAPDWAALVGRDPQIPGATPARKLELVRAFLRSDAAADAMVQIARAELSTLVPEALAALRRALVSKQPEVSRKAAVHILTSVGAMSETALDVPTRIVVISESRAGRVATLGHCPPIAPELLGVPLPSATEVVEAPAAPAPLEAVA